MAIVNPTDSHEIINCLIGSKMGKSGSRVGITSFRVGLGTFTFGPCGLTAGPVGSHRGPVVAQRGKVGSQMGKSGFPNGDGDCQFNRQARDFELFSRFPNGKIWVLKWGNLGSKMGIEIVNPTDMQETLSCFLGTNMRKSGFPNGDHFVPSWARYVHIRALWVDSGPGGFTARARWLPIGESGFPNVEIWIPKWGRRLQI
jgi:hypothetical protein